MTQNTTCLYCEVCNSVVTAKCMYQQ